MYTTDFPTNIIFPNFKSRVVHDKHEAKWVVVHETWVKVDRGDKSYLVYHITKWRTDDQSPQELLQSQKEFFDRCFATMYLWQVPSERTMLEMKEKGILVETTNHLDMKERFLLKFYTPL